MFYIRTIYTDCSRAYRILRHVLYHSAAKSEKETSQLAAGSCSCVVTMTSCPTSSDSFLLYLPSEDCRDPLDFMEDTRSYKGQIITDGATELYSSEDLLRLDSTAPITSSFIKPVKVKALRFENSDGGSLNSYTLWFKTDEDTQMKPIIEGSGNEPKVCIRIFWYMTWNKLKIPQRIIMHIFNHSTNVFSCFSKHQFYDTYIESPSKQLSIGNYTALKKARDMRDPKCQICLSHDDMVHTYLWGIFS